MVGAYQCSVDCAGLDALVLSYFFAVFPLGHAHQADDLPCGQLADFAVFGKALDGAVGDVLVSVCGDGHGVLPLFTVEGWGYGEPVVLHEALAFSPEVVALGVVFWPGVLLARFFDGLEQDQADGVSDPGVRLPVEEVAYHHRLRPPVERPE